MSTPTAIYPGLGTYDPAKCRDKTCACPVIERPGSFTTIHRGVVCAGADLDYSGHRYGPREAVLRDGVPVLVERCRFCKTERVL